MRPLRFLRYLARRLCVWAYAPTTREQLHAMFELGKTAERSEQLQLPIAKSQQQTGPIELPPAIQWPNMAWSRHFFEQRPDLYKPPRFTARVRRIELVPDDSWLNSGPPERDTESTKTVPAVKMQALHPRR